MGGGKGAIDHYVTPIKAGRVIIELGGKIELKQVLPFLIEVADKLPFRAKVMSFEQMQAKRALQLEQENANKNPFTAEYVIKNNMGGCHNWISCYDKKWFFKYV